ncbi:MFS transporter [Streptomyces sp. NPDC004296]|uniref:MFS transporter n=1 Tax=Streptomyces sp. NPDC004296 TaxID=3364697 RepID=UPI0036A78733
MTTSGVSTNVTIWDRKPLRRIWAASMASEIGTAVSTLAIPMTALQALSASPLEMSVLAALPAAAFLLCALPFGAYVDQHDRRRLMVWADIVRALLTAVVPLAWALDFLSLPLLWALTFASGCATVLFTLAYQSVIPSVVPRSELVGANAKMAIPASTGEVLGPSAGGLVVGLTGAPAAVLVNSMTFVLSGSFLGSFQVVSASPTVRPTRLGLRSEISQGLRFVFGHRVLRRIVGCLGVTNFFVSMRTALVVLFLVRNLHASATLTGLTMGAGSVGGVLGALTARRLISRFGELRILWLMKSAFGWVVLLVPLAFPRFGVSLAVVGLFASSCTAMVFSVAQTSYRQSVCPPELLGRMNASVRWVIWGVMPLGALSGGLLATLTGVRIALLVSALGMVSSVIFVGSAEFRRARSVVLER